MNKARFFSAAQVLLIYTVIVILWGAWVRISHSGDGCGETWPLCQGDFLPQTSHSKTWIEYAHRLMSGLYGIFVVVIFFWARRLFPKFHPLRTRAGAVLILMITEALLGAQLVLLGLVGSNDSWTRGLVMPLHQINSFLLTGATVLLVIQAKRNELNISVFEMFRKFRGWFFFIFFLAITGAIAALSTTLFPSLSIWEGLQKDFHSESHLFLRARSLHPLVALIFGTGLAMRLYKTARNESISWAVRASAERFSLVFVLALLFGIFTLLLLSPSWMKIVHLGLAHWVWMTFISHAVISLDSAKR